jgi:hypothetical protein
MRGPATDPPPARVDRAHGPGSRRIGLLAGAVRAPSGRPRVRLLPYVEGHGPRSLLWQQEFDRIKSRPRDGLRPPKTSAGAGEEVLGDRLACKIRNGAGQLTPLVDECSDRAEATPAVGTYLVAGNPVALRAYMNSGLEDRGSKDVHVDDGDASEPQMGAVDIPAVRRAQTAETSASGGSRRRGRPRSRSTRRAARATRCSRRASIPWSCGRMLPAARRRARQALASARPNVGADV